MLVTLSECLLNIVRNTVDIGVSTPSPLQKHCHLFLAKPLLFENLVGGSISPAEREGAHYETTDV